MSIDPDDDYEEPLTPREIETVLRDYIPRTERRRIIMVLKRAKLVVYPAE